MELLENLRNLQLRSLGTLADYVVDLLERKLWLKIIIALVVGVGLGVAMGPSTGWVRPDVAEIAGEWLALPGQIFLGGIQMIMVPLVFASIIRGLASSNSVDQLRKLGVRLVVYFVATTIVAVGIGLAAAYVIRPGQYIDSVLLEQAMGGASPPTADAGPPRSVPQIVSSLISINPLGAMVEGEMLPVVLFAIIVGIALISMTPSSSRPLLDVLGSLQEVCMTIVRWAMRLAPFAVFGLLARITMSLGLQALVGMGIYVLTVLAGLAALVLVYWVLVAVLARRSPWDFARKVRNVQLLGFSTSSSAAVMPLSIKTAEEDLAVRPSIAQFIVPLGATINMDGTALYQAVATVFLAQVTGVDLSLAAIGFLVATTVGSSIGAPSTPGVGIVLLAGVLRNVGIPVEAVALIIGVDRILDMSRTAVNVTGDLTACVVMDRMVGGELPEKSSYSTTTSGAGQVNPTTTSESPL